MSDGAIEVWRGGVNPWQCDQMGHLNVRFYVAHATEGLAALAAALGMKRPLAPSSDSTLVPREHHIRFFREARVGDALHMTAGVRVLEDDHLQAQQILFHSLSDEPAAIFQTRAAHARAADAMPFAWPRSIRERAAGLQVEVPEGRGPRSLEPGAGRTNASLALAEQLGLARHATGLFGPEDCDPFGRVQPWQVMGRLGDGASHAIAHLRHAVAGLIPGDPPVGMAVMEYRLTYLDWPGAGDRYDVRSAWTAVEPRRLRFEHWVLDPESGRAWAAAEVVLVVFDLDARKTVTLPDDGLEALRRHVVAIP